MDREGGRRERGEEGSVSSLVLESIDRIRTKIDR